MPLSSDSIVGSDFGSQYMYLKYLNNNLYNSLASRKSNSSLLAEAYREMFFSQYYYANNVLDGYLERTGQTGILRNDDAAYYQNSLVTNTFNSNYGLSDILQYELDRIIPENSTVSYHV